MCEVLAPDEKLGPTLSLCKLNTACYQRIVSAYLGAGVPNALRRNSGLALAVVSNQKIVGLFHYELTWRWNAVQGEAGLKLDLAVPTTLYRRLSKLVLRAALSRESRLLVEQLYKRRVTHAVTTVFSQHPESMKYRSMFKRTVSEPLKDSRYRLRYRGRFTDKPLSEHYAEWRAQEVGQSCVGSVDGDTPFFQEGVDGSSPSRALFGDRKRDPMEASLPHGRHV